MGIEGNEVADKLAKSAIHKSSTDILKISFGKTEAKSQINEGIIASWQDIWNKDTKLLAWKPD